MPQGNKTLFSVIVPAYNVEDYITQCIDSVLTQSLQDFELIIIDDGSTDQTGKICSQYQKKYPTVKVVHQTNAGLSKARNTGVKQASGKYLIFLDGDDYLEKNALEVIQKSLEPDLDLLRYQAQEVFTNGEKLRYDEPGFETVSGVQAFPKLARQHYTENAWLYAYRREFFVKNHFRYADGCLAEDLGLTPLIIARANKVKAIPDICYNYRQREGSIMHDETKVSRRIADIIKQYQKILPEIATIPNTEPILHYLVVSFLTGATELESDKFLAVYQEAKKSGMLRYIYPTNLKAIPRALILKYFPRLFHQIYSR